MVKHKEAFHVEGEGLVAIDFVPCICIACNNRILN